MSVVVKRHVRLDGSAYPAHSLKSGLITQAIRAGKRERRVEKDTGHKAWAAFDECVKRSGTFKDNPAEDIGI